MSANILALNLERRRSASARKARTSQKAHNIVAEELERIRRDALRAAFKITRNFSASCDIAQNICARLLSMPEATRSKIRHLGAYATMAARNGAINWYRVENRHASFNDAHDVPAESSDPCEGVCTQEEVLHWLETLPHSLSVPLVLYWVYGYTAQECAPLLGISVDAVRKRVHRALKILRAQSRVSFPSEKTR